MKIYDKRPFLKDTSIMNIRINIRAATFNIMILSTINVRDLKQLEPLVDVEKSFSKVGTLKNELGSEFILRGRRYSIYM